MPFKLSIRQFIQNCHVNIIHQICESEALKDEHQYAEMKSMLLNTLSETYPSVKIHFFGSRIIGLAGKNSNLDIFIEIGKFLFNY